MGCLSWVEKIVGFVAWVLLMVTVVALGGLFLITLTDIFAILTGLSFQGSVEISEYLLVAIIFLGLAYAQTRQTHIKVEFFVSILRREIQVYIDVFVLLVTPLFFILMAYQIGQEAYSAWSKGVYHPGWADFAVPTWPPILVASIGCFVLALALLTQLLRKIAEVIDIHRKASLTGSGSTAI